MSALSGRISGVYQTHAKDASVRGEGPRRFVDWLGSKRRVIARDGKGTRFIANQRRRTKMLYCLQSNLRVKDRNVLSFTILFKGKGP